METVHTAHILRAGNRQLTITKSENSVDIRITRYHREDPYNVMDEKLVEEDLNIPISLETYEKLVHEMRSSC